MQIHDYILKINFYLEKGKDFIEHAKRWHGLLMDRVIKDVNILTEKEKNDFQEKNQIITSLITRMESENEV